MSALYPTVDLAYLGILLVFFRMLGLFLLVPGFSHSAIPQSIKVLTALSISLVLFPVVKPFVHFESTSLLSYGAAVIRETSVGLLLGFVAMVTFEAISLGAQFVGYQMGLGTVAMMDPESHTQVSAMVPFQAWIAVMVFFLSDLHHHVLQVFTESFRATHAFEGMANSNPALLNFVIGLTAKLFSLAIQLAAPITLMVLCCNVVIGMLSRMMPQMNILLFSFPITLTLGFAGLYLVAPEWMDSLELLLGETSNELIALLRVL